jgi:type I restriction enzyme, S subunit
MFPNIRMKFALDRNDAGVWGDDSDPASAVPVLRSTEISLEGWINPADPAMRNLSRGEVAATRLRRGDIIIVKSSGSDAHLGKSGWVDERSENMSFSNFIQRVRVNDEFDSRFVWYFLNSRAMKEQVRVLSSTSTGLQNLSASIIREAALPAPSLTTQRRVAGFLDRTVGVIDESSRLYRSVRARLLERRAAMIFRLVTGVGHSDRKNSSLAWAESIPSGWRSVKLSYVAKLGSGHTPSRSVPEWWDDCTIPWVTTGEVGQIRSDRLEYLMDTREKISRLGLENSSAEIHPVGTVALSRTASAGFSAIMADRMATSQDFATWTCGPRLMPEYLLWCLRAMRADLLDRLAMGSTHKTIYMPDLQGLRIPLPGVEEQVRIVADIRRSNGVIDTAIDAVSRQLQLLAERRSALISDAVTGQIDVAAARGAAI